MDVALFLHGKNLITYYYEENLKENILLLPGLPSLPCKKEVAKLFSEIGYNTLLLHYRGTWGSLGFFSGNPKEEIKEVVESWGGKFKNVFSGKTLEVEKPEIAVGFSYGGFVSLLSSELFKRVVAFAPPISLKGEEKVIESLKNAGYAYRLNEESYEVMEIKLKRENFRNALVVHGKEDDIVDYSKNKEFYEREGIRYVSIEAGHYPSSYLLKISLEEVKSFLTSSL